MVSIFPQKVKILRAEERRSVSETLYVYLSYGYLSWQVSYYYLPMTNYREQCNNLKTNMKTCFHVTTCIVMMCSRFRNHIVLSTSKTLSMPKIYQSINLKIVDMAVVRKHATCNMQHATCIERAIDGWMDIYKWLAFTS